MEIQEQIINKVAQSGLITIDLASYVPTKEVVPYDIAQNLFHGLILKEKDFRAFVKEHNWSQYEDKHIAITCSTEAIIPTWAYMILANKMTAYAESIHFGTEQEAKNKLLLEAIDQIDYSQYEDQRIVVKGCGDIHIPEAAFISFTSKLTAVAKSIMYGEPCSTVPVYKRKN